MIRKETNVCYVFFKAVKLRPEKFFCATLNKGDI